MTYHLKSGEIPILYDVDAVIIGGSFAGIAIALRMANKGKKVAIIESRTYLGSELTASLRPWFDAIDVSNVHLPDLIKHVLQEDTPAYKELGSSSYMPLHPDQLKRDLEDILEAHQIELLYATLPIQIMEQAGRVSGIAVANKSGRQVIACTRIIDTTETAIAASLSGEPIAEFGIDGTALYSRTLEFTNVEPIEERTLEVPEHLNIVNNRIILRNGYRGTSHLYVIYTMELDHTNSLQASRDREGAARHLGMDLASHLIHHIAAFHKATFAAGSHELLGPYAIRTTNSTVSLSDIATRSSGVFCLGKALWQGESALLDAVQASSIGERIADELLNLEFSSTDIEQTIGDDPVDLEPDLTRGDDPVNLEPDLEVEGVGKSADSAQIHVPSWIAIHRYAAKAKVKELNLPLLKQVEVLVVGGGTSGANASITAAGEGMNTMLLELNPGLGGTGTFGGVDSYWFGKRSGYAANITEKVMAVQQEIRYKGHKWSIEAKMEALLREGDRSGVDMLFNVITFGAIKRGNQVCGVVVATRWGAYSVMSETVIDATGDGDIAAYAGAEYVYGSEKDNTVMWFSLAQFQAPDKIQNNFTSMVDVSDIHDYTRAIRVGRRRGTDCHDHGIYVATRESRHIVGDVTMRLSDQLLHRKWSDVINIHFSNHDVKGVSGADWVNVGMIPPNLEIEIPYRMLLPRGLEGLLVVGKAFSATHDALPAIRMQSDLENLGGVAALAASMAIRTNTSLRMINMEVLQGRLIQEELLPPSVQSRKLSQLHYTDQELEQLVQSIETGPLYEYPNMRMNEVYRTTIPFVEICSVGPRIIPFLQRALKQAEGAKQVRIAQALSMLASDSGNSVLIDAIMEDLQGIELPIRTAEMMYVQLPPDHGAMPDAAYLLYSLAQMPDPDCLAVWQRVADLLLPDVEAFKDTYKGIYYYVDAVCQGAERLGDRNAIPVLEQIHRNPLFYHQYSAEGAQPDYFLERRAMLELAIGRALARCGGQTGYLILIAYLTDHRSLLSKNALLELRRLSGESFEKEPIPWQGWLAKERPYEQTYPQLIRLDIELDSESLMRREL